MDRSRPRGTASPRVDDARLPRVSRMTLRPGRANRRQRTALRERLPAPREVADACGRALRRSAPVLVALAVASAVGTAGVFGYRWVTTTPRFAVTTIEVNGEVVLDEAEVRARLPFAPGINIFRVDTGAAEAALAAEPWVRKASVRRRLPHTVIVDITERQPAALVSADRLYLADAAGAPFKPADLARGEGRDLPIISGIPRALFADAPEQALAQIHDGLALLAAWHAGPRPRAGEVKLAANGATVYTYDDAIAVRVGALAEGQLPDRLARFDAVWAALSPDERARLRTIRVDNDTRTDLVTVSFRSN
ncbi:MAG: FtsQ-type POTRA domain-containing protein [Kofleriaceae bacterium]